MSDSSQCPCTSHVRLVFDGPGATVVDQTAISKGNQYITGTRTIDPCSCIADIQVIVNDDDPQPIGSGISIASGDSINIQITDVPGCSLCTESSPSCFSSSSSQSSVSSSQTSSSALSSHASSSALNTTSSSSSLSFGLSSSSSAALQSSASMNSGSAMSSSSSSNGVVTTDCTSWCSSGTCFNWLLTVTTTDGGCCGEYGGTFHMNYAGLCSWISTEGGGCAGAGFKYWTMYIDGTGHVNIGTNGINPTPSVLYTSTALFDCCNAQTVPRVSQVGCSGFAATCTLTPLCSCTDQQGPPPGGGS